MQRTYALDIETVAIGAAKDYVKNNTEVKYGNTKDEAKKEKKFNETMDKALSKLGLHWWTGKVCSFALVNTDGGQEYYAFDEDERVVLNTLSEIVKGSKIVAMTGEDFDVPFLVGRYMANNMAIPTVFKNKIEEVNKYFGFSSSSGQRTNLNNYAYGLGIELKTGKGNQVQALYDAITLMNCKDSAKTLEEYNIHDARIVADMYNRYHKGASKD
jgi:hypothetical protein